MDMNTYFLNIQYIYIHNMKSYFKILWIFDGLYYAKYLKFLKSDKNTKKYVDF